MFTSMSTKPKFPAARIGDPLTHDMLVPCGAIALPVGPPTVIIEGMPAATVGCLCACTGSIMVGSVHPPPPLPVPIAKGSPSVMINYMPAARWTPSGDTAGCGVFLGDPKLAPTRKTFIGD